MRHHFSVLRVVGRVVVRVEPGVPFTTLKAPLKPAPDLCADSAHVDLSQHRGVAGGFPFSCRGRQQSS